MDNRDREAIEDLFGKLSDVERQAGPRDAEAERFIADQLGRQPGAPYYMAQTIVMQDMALANQQTRIEELERALATRQAPGETGLLSRMFGGTGNASQSVPSVGSQRAGGAWGGAAGAGASRQGAASHQNNATPYGQSPAQARGRPGMGGGGFLAGAAQTAMGVAGGVLLGNAVMGMFSGDEAVAAETPAAEPEPAVEDASVEEAGGDDGGGWFGGDDGGGFDEI